MTSLLILAPLFLTLFLVSYTVLGVIQQISKAEFLCIKSAVRIQNTLRGNLKKLMGLNFKVRLAKRARLLAKKAHLAALAAPPAIAAAYKALKAAEAWQKRLREKQKALLLKSETDVRRGVLSFKMKTRGFLTDIRSKKEKALAVEEDPPGDAFPEYILMNDFYERQKIIFYFKVNSLKLLPERAANFFNIQKFYDGDCGAALKGNPEFSIHLAAPTKEVL